VLNILKGAWKGFGEDECGTRAAALAYSTIFALPPLLILLVMIAGKVWGPQQVQSALETQFSGMVGADAGSQVGKMIEAGQSNMGHGVLATILGIVGLLLGATGAFLALQDALNKAWNVEPDPKQGGIKNFITKRLLSIGMVLGLGFLVAASLALSAAISSFAGLLGGLKAVAFAVDLVVSLVVLTVLFGALFKFLPDADVSWRDVWVGGIFTAVLFVIGKFAIGLYLGKSHPGSSFGAASALAILLVWIYYAGMIVLFGAEFTQAWARQRGHGIEPAKGAVRIVEREVEIGSHGPVPAMAKNPSTEDRAAADRPLPNRGTGGIGDWIIGLPALYFLVRRRGKSRNADEESPIP
jgi:membrane protein